MGERWEKPGDAHASPMLHVGRVGKGWAKGWKSQAMPMLVPCFM